MDAVACIHFLYLVTMKKIKRTIVFIITVIAIVVFATVLVHAIFYSTPTDITVPDAKDAITVPKGDYPVTLSIPALKINAKVQQVGVTGTGKMAVPTNYTDVGWYKYGPEPGQAGSVVIDGHVDDGLALPGVFSNLSDLKKGDDIYITMKDGEVIHYAMLSSQTYDKDVADTQNIFKQNGSEYLKLITCTGTWLPALRTHNERLVVTAVLQKK